MLVNGFVDERVELEVVVGGRGRSGERCGKEDEEGNKKGWKKGPRRGIDTTS